MQEDEADAIFDSLSSSSSISSLSNDNVNENSNKEINDEEKEREEHPERFADLCDSYGNPIPKEKRNIKTTSEITKQKDNRKEDTINNIESEINTEKEVVSDINERIPDKEVNRNTNIQLPKENEEELDSFDELERQIIQGELFAEDNEMNIQNEIINNEAPPVISSLNEKDNPIDNEPIFTTQKKTFSVLKQKRERPKKKQIEEIEKPKQPQKKVDPKEKLQKKIEKNISRNKRKKKDNNSEDSDDYSSSQVSTKSSGNKANVLKKIPISQNSFKNTDEEIMQLYKEKEVLKNPSYDLDPNAFNIEETQNLINDCIMEIDSRNKPYLIKLYEIIEKYKPNRNNLSFDISGILSILDKEDRKLNKIGYFFLVMLCNSLLTHAEKKGNIIKTTKDVWSKERLDHFFKTHKYQKGSTREQKKTKEEINVLLSKNGYYQSIVAQFEKYKTNGKINELSSLLPDLIVNMYIKGLTHQIEEKTQLYRTNYFIVYAKYLKESNKFTMEVEYQNMKTNSNSDSDS